MEACHIHIKGVVQGVGFRPYVYRLAKTMGVKGWINNSTDGVHILAVADEEVLRSFYQEIIAHPPANAHIIYHHADWVMPGKYDDFFIEQSHSELNADLMITPDFGLCKDCLRELFDSNNRRYRYPFITCTDCGPRYSIINDLPYDRPLTAMAPFVQCSACQNEYDQPVDRRYFSQTNSCATCGISLSLYDATGRIIADNYHMVLLQAQQAFARGETLAVKGVGGYLLMCDATNAAAIEALRKRKHRPAKPFALLYPNIAMAEMDVQLSNAEQALLHDVTAPIVLCQMKAKPGSGICAQRIAPGLSKLGIMLPYSPLLALLAHDFAKPLIATSGNVSGSPIIYNDEDALEVLGEIADKVLVYHREIVVPQDDSVIQFSRKHRQKIIVRRSRGMAPNFFDAPFHKQERSLLAMGAELKGSFAMLSENRCYISQFLGDQQSYESQEAYTHTLSHLRSLAGFSPEVILVDKHPGYHVSMSGKSIAAAEDLPLVEIQHHKAHACAVLAENDLLDSQEPILAVTWDGTGYGDDKQVWGGEFFIYHKGSIQRHAHLDYFAMIAGDAMAMQPRLSALAITQHTDDALPLLANKFTAPEWNYYSQLISLPTQLHTSSAGRLLDGIASLLGIVDKASYEGEAAMQLEVLASRCDVPGLAPYPFFMNGVHLDWRPMIGEILSDINNGISKANIAFKVHLTLAMMIKKVADKSGIKQVAFSGGVFQNALLTDLLIDVMPGHQLYFHKQLSPNDECISFGQLAYYYVQEYIKPAYSLQPQTVTACV